MIAAARSGPSADAWAIAPLVDLALIVVELHGSRHDEVRELAAKLELVGAPAVSAVVVAGAAAGGPVGVEERAASERPPRSSRPVAVGLLVASVVVAAGVGLRALTAGPPEDAASRAATTARGGDPDSGASRTRPRIRVAARANERGDLRVVERVLTERPVRRLRLAPPSHPLSDSAPRLIDLRLVSDGIPVAGPGSVTSAGLEVSLPSRSRRIRLSYWVVGAAAHSPQAPPGRVTMALGSTLRHDLPDLPVTTALSGVPILTLLCRDAPQDRQLCGLEKETGWRTTPLPAHRSAVVALADLPAP